jgi:uncharacterized RDD family membrane protein YckC
MDQILDSPLHSQQEMRFAGFWIRVGAALIDSIIIWLVCAAGLLLLFNFDLAHVEGEKVVIFYLFFIVGIYVYIIVMESSSKQATLGKIAVGIKVGKFNGERISFMNALGRVFAKKLSAMIFYIGFMMAGWDSKKQALHDKLANTYVYYG